LKIAAFGLRLAPRLFRRLHLARALLLGRKQSRQMASQPTCPKAVGAPE